MTPTNKTWSLKLEIGSGYSKVTRAYLLLRCSASSYWLSSNNIYRVDTVVYMAGNFELEEHN